MEVINNAISIATLDSLMEQQFPETRWIIENLIPEGGLTIVSAAPGSFKTWLMLEMILAVATGKKLFDKYETIQTGALLVDEESGPRMLQERFKQLSAKSSIPVHFSSRQNIKVNDLFVQELIEICNSKSIKLVMFDSLVRLHSGDENTSKDMSNLFGKFRLLTDNGIAVLIAHHNRKPGQGNSYNSADMRGSSDILASADCHIAMSRQNNSDNVIIHQTKNRYVPEIKPFKLRFIHDENMSYFEFIGENANRSDKRAVDKKNIVDSLTYYDKKTTKRVLYDSLRDKDNKIGMNKLGDYLDELIADGKVAIIDGPKNATYYYLLQIDGVR